MAAVAILKYFGYDFLRGLDRGMYKRRGLALQVNAKEDAG
jgi:hypothetical protein